MNDAVLVRRFERVGNLFRDRERVIKRNRALRDEVGQRRAIYELEDKRLAPRLP